jgi:hypothetical protein
MVDCNEFQVPPDFLRAFNLLTPRNENFASHPKAYLKAIF